MRILKTRRVVVLASFALAAGLVLLLSTALASAGDFTESYTDSIAPTDTDWVTPPGPPDPLTFPQFDPNKGTLTKVTIDYESSLTGSMGAENISTTSTCDVTLDWGADVSLDTLDGILTSALGQVEGPIALPTFDGLIDFGGDSGVTFADLSQTDSQSKEHTNPAVLALFTGSGTVTLPAAATGDSVATGCGTVTSFFLTEAAVDVTVTYFFSNDPSIDIEKATNGEDADSPTGPLVPVGDPVVWTYVVTNTGDVPLFDVVVTDDILGVIPGPDSGDLNTNGILETTETWIYSAGDTAALGQYANISDVVGSPLVGEPVTDEDPSHYLGIDPAASITIEPDATNEVGTPHDFVVTVQEDPLGDGNFVPAAGETVDVTFASANGADANPDDQCTTDAAGQCTVTVNSAAAGTITATASSTVDVAGTQVTVTTDGVAPNSDPAVKTYVDAKIGIDPNATNLVTDPHTFTTTVWVDDGSGAGFVAYEGAAVEVTLTNGGGAVANPAGPFNGSTDVNGEYDVTFTSATPGTVTGHATATVTIDGVVLVRETDGIAPNTDDAIKTFIDPAAKIAIEADATNEVGSPHEFTVTVMEDPLGDGNFVAAEGEAVDVTYVSTNGADVNAPDACVTDPAGECTVTINSDAAGQITATASSDVDVSGTIVSVTTDGVAPNSGPAVKTYVDAKIGIDPNATNLVTDPHTFTTTVWVDDGTGTDADGEMGTFDRAPDADVAVTLANSGGAVADPPGPFAGLTDANGEFAVTFTSATPGTVTGHGATTVVVGGETLVRETDGLGLNSDDAIKTFVAPNIDIEKATNGEDADTPTGPEIPVGDTVTWTYVVTNTGDVPLANVVVTDTILGVIAGPDSGDDNNNAILETTEVWLYSATGIAEEGQYANLGIVVGEPASGPPVADEDPSHYIGILVGGEGCTPGYWKQPQHFWAWTGYDQDESYADVFGVPYDKTLLEALKAGGGAEKALGRHSVAALLNAANGDVDYAYTEAQIIALVQDAWATGDFNAAKNLLEYENEMGCPIGRAPRS